MNCLNVVEHSDPRFGGIVASVPAFADAMAAIGPYRSRTTTLGEAGGGEFERLVADADLVHVHGLWRSHAVAACRTAMRHRKPYLVSAHGMLAPWALQRRRWKKLLYGALIERRNLRRASCLRALTPQEAIEYRKFGVGQPVAVVPNGVDLPGALSPEPFFAPYPELRGRRLFLFAGRLHPSKGADLLCRAWSDAPRRAGDHLVVAGADFENRRASLAERASDDVTFTGLLPREVLQAALAAAHVFVLPSRADGLSVALLEALAAGVPAIATHAGNLPEIATRRCGWVVEPEAAAVTRAIGEAIDLSDADRQSMGANARRFVAKRFAWPIVAAQMAALYEWIIGGTRPANVEFCL